MYQSISVQVAQARHTEMVAEAARASRAREARKLVPAGQPRARRRGGPRQPVPHLRPQTQS
jgi:hypothetical protein